MRGKDGTVTGYYSYAGGDGRVVYVNYVADKDGYRVLSNTGVPSASVAVEGGPVEKTAGPSAAADRDFQQVFSDFAKRIKVLFTTLTMGLKYHPKTKLRRKLFVRLK